MKTFSCEFDFVESIEKHSQLTIPVERQKELEEIIGVMHKKERRDVSLKIGSNMLDAHFYRYEQGQLKLRFGRGSKEALATLSDICVGVQLDYIGNNTFEISVIDAHN